MSNAVGSVIVAAAQSVAKVYVIGGIGYAAVQFPKKAPLLPPGAVSTVARFSFNVTTIPLIFSTIASSVTIDSMGDYWFVVVGSLGVLGLSFLTATVLAYCIPISNAADYQALRIAVTFPNIVALPILIFPSLCEYEVVYSSFATATTLDRADQYSECINKSNTMIFCYFFGWSLLFWSCGHPALMSAAEEKSNNATDTEKQIQPQDAATKKDNQQQQQQQQQIIETQGKEAATSSTDNTPQFQSAALTIANTDHGSSTADDDSQKTATTSNKRLQSIMSNIQHAVKQTFSSPPFIAMLLAFVVGCIAPVRDLFFSPGGALRFFGAAMETLGTASSPLSTMVVAASLASREKELVVKDKDNDDNDNDDNNDCDDHCVIDDNDDNDKTNQRVLDEENPSAQEDHTHPIIEMDNLQNPDHNNSIHPIITIQEESPIMSDPNFGPIQLRRRSSMQRFGSALRRKSMGAIQKARRTPPEQRRMLVWFTLSRLIVSPALVVLAIVGLDCSGVLVRAGVPDLAKLVLIVNASVPGALLVVVLLKSNPQLHDTASVVARVYLPTYIISILTIAAWTAVGLLVSIPDDEGNSFCARYH